MRIVTLTAVVVISLLQINCFNENTEDAVNHLVNYCSVPRYAPYIYVKNVTFNSIIIGVTDPNDPEQVTGYVIHFWGYRNGLKSALQTEDRNFGKRILSPGQLIVQLGPIISSFTRTVGPHVIDGLKPGFVYCADITATNNCGHGPYCVACFENVTTLI